MKKKLFILTVVLLLAMLPAMAQRYYSDRANGYGGLAFANYLGTTKEYDLSDFDSEDYISFQTEKMKKGGCVITRLLQKLSKEEVFLIWKSLDEYNVRDKEVYSVTVKRTGSSEYLDLVVEIRDKGKSFRYYGGFYFKEK